MVDIQADPDKDYTSQAKQFSRLLTVITGNMEKFTDSYSIQTSAKQIEQITREEPVAPHTAFKALKQAHESLKDNPEVQAIIVQAIANVNQQERGQIAEIADFVKEHAPRAATASSGVAGAGRVR